MLLRLGGAAPVVAAVIAHGYGLRRGNIHTLLAPGEREDIQITPVILIESRLIDGALHVKARNVKILALEFLCLAADCSEEVRCQQSKSPVIVFGTVASWIYGLIYWIISLY